jgi:hypothetical protein
MAMQDADNAVWFGLNEQLRSDTFAGKEDKMLWTIFVILLIAWLLGIVSSYTLGGFIHLLLLVALVVLLINIITGRRAAI